MTRILIAGGGTGGHIYPAISIAQALKKKDPLLEVHFVGTTHGLEKKIVPREGYPLHFILAGALNGVSVFRKIISLMLLPLGVVQSCILILKLRPKTILGVGGYASGPTMLAGFLLCRRLGIFEPNSYPGLTNRWLGRLVSDIFVNFEATKKFFRNAQVVGIPVRQELVSAEKVPSASSSNDPFRILIFGGSQGARGINKTVLEAVKRGGPWLQNSEIVHQIGAADFFEVKAEYTKLGKKNIESHEFLYDMPLRYSWAHLVLCRAGASTLAELAACHKASVLVPFPAASDNHQLRNAQSLEERQAAIIIEQKDFTPEKFISIVEEFRKSPLKSAQLEEKIHKFYIPKCAEKIAEKLLKDNK